MIRRKMTLASAIVLSAGIGFTAPATAEDDIVVGHLTYHTGEFGAFGPFFDGILEMVISKINADPPLGRDLVPVHQDLGTIGEARAARKLVDSDGADILFGPAHEYLSYREFMLETVAKKGYPIMPAVHGGAIESSIGGKAEEPIFRGSPADTANGTAALLHVEEAGKKNVVIVATEAAGSQIQKEAAVRTAENLGFEVLGDFDIQAGESNYRAVVSRIKRLNPESVVMFSSPQAGGSFVKNAAQAGASWYIVGSGEWQETEFYDTATESAISQHEAVVLAANSHADNPSFDPYVEFSNASEWAEDIGDPSNSYAIQYYDLLVASALAIEKAGEINAASWTEAMFDVTSGEGEVVYTYEDGIAAIRDGREINYDGVTGTMDYSDTGVASALFGIFEWKDGAISQVGSVAGDKVMKFESL